MDKGKLSSGADLLRLSTLGINFALCAFVGLFLGWLLKRALHLGDWVTMAGFFIGILAGFFTLVQTLRSLNRRPPPPPVP